MAAPADAPTAAPAAAPAPTPKDERASWVVAFSVLETSGLSAAQAYLAYSIPLLLRDQLASFHAHAVSPEERDGLAEAAIGRARAALLARVGQLRTQRDAALFAPPATTAPAGAPAAPSAASPEAQLAEALAQLEALDALDPAAVEVPSVKPIEVKSGEDVAMLRTPPVASAPAACAAAGLDVLIGGSVRMVEGYLLLDLWAWDGPAGRQAFTYREAASQDELYDKLADAGRSLGALMAGREWAALEVVPQPPDARVSVDEGPAQTGRAGWQELDPGTHQVTVKAPGYLDETQSVELAPSTETVLEVALRQLQLGTISVASDPPGADAYLGGVWQGRTPFEFPRPAVPGRLMLRRSGSYDMPIAIGPETPAELAVTLLPDIGARSDLQRAARDRFYTSFGLAALSAPIPFFCYAWAVDWAYEAQRLLAAGSVTGAQRAVTIATGLYWGYIGGMALTATLATWTIFNLVRYVRAADRPAD